MSYTEQEILEVLKYADGIELPLSQEQIAQRFERYRKFYLEEADITNFANVIDEWLRGYENIQSSKIKWIAVLLYLEQKANDVRALIADCFPA